MIRKSSAARGHAAAAILILLIFLVSPAVLSAERTSDAESRDDAFAAMDGCLGRQLEQLHIPGAALAVVEGSEVVHFYGYGESRPGGEQPSLTTPFVLGSLTKSFTAMAVMQLAEAGRIDPDAPVREYLPWFETADPGASAGITVRHLLNQTGGLSMLAGMKHLANFDESPDACEQRVRELETFDPSRAPGEGFEYSDVNYNLLGLVIEAASGERYGDYIERHIFAPLGMVHSYTDHAEAVRDRMAVGHRMHFGWTKPEPDLRRPVGSTPSGQLISSAGDMARYLTAMLQGGTVEGVSLLSPDGTAELVRPAVSAGSMGVDMGDYAMGWFVEDTGGGRRIWHDGMVPDFFAYMVMLPEQDRGLVLLVNANHMIVNFALLDISAAITDMLAGLPVETEEAGGMPGTLRFFLIVPLLQILGIAFTLSRIKRWRISPERRPKKAVLLLFHLVPASVLHFLLAASAAALPIVGMTRFMLLFMPDLTGLLLTSGGISFIWLGIRTRLILHSARAEIVSPGGGDQVLPRRDSGDSFECIVEGAL